MNTQTRELDWGLWAWWFVATFIGWIVGVIGGFFLTYAVVIPVYHKETNMILGLCVGGAVSLSQMIAVRRRMPLTQSWLWGAMIGLGLPFVVGAFWPVAQAPLVVVGAALCGYLQVPALRPHVSGAYWWVLASTILWCMGFVSIGSGTAAVHSALSGFVVILLRSLAEADSDRPTRAGGGHPVATHRDALP